MAETGKEGEIKPGEGEKKDEPRVGVGTEPRREAGGGRQEARQTGAGTQKGMGQRIEETLKCNECQMTFESRPALESHMSTAHAKV